MPPVAAVGAKLAIAKLVAFIAAAAYTIGSAADARRKAKHAAADARGITTMVKSATEEWGYVYGERRVSGPIVFVQETGQDRKYLHLVIVLAPHEVFDIKWIWFDDEVVSFDGPGNAASSGNYVNKAWCWRKTGAATDNGFPELTAECPEWTSAHRLDGYAAIHVKLEYDENFYRQGLPNISATLRGKKTCSPFYNDTVWSANPACALLDYLRDTKIGLGVADAEIDFPSFLEAEQVCGQTMATPSPAPSEYTASRYACNLYVDSAVDPHDNVASILATMAGTLTRSNGKWFCRAGAYRTPTVTIEQKDLVGEVRILPRVSKKERCNRVRGTFCDITNNFLFTPAEFPPYKNATYLTEDLGEELWATLDLPGVVDPIMAQRLAKIHLERSRQQIVCDLPLGTKGFQIMPSDTVMVTLPRYGWSSKVFEVLAWSMQVSPDPSSTTPLSVRVTLRETASAVWNWNNGEETTVDPAPDTDLPDAFDIPDPVSPTLTQSGNVRVDGVWQSTVTLSWTAVANGYVQSGGQVVARIKLSTDTDYRELAPVAGNQTSMQLTGLLLGPTYNVQVANQNSYGVRSDWVSCSPITIAADTTAPAAPSGFSASSNLLTQPPAGLSVVAGNCVAAAKITFVEPTVADYSHAEFLLAANTNDPNGFPPPNLGNSMFKLTPGVRPKGENHFTVYTETATFSQSAGVNVYASTSYLWGRSVDYSGNKSAWVSAGSVKTLASGKWVAAQTNNTVAPVDNIVTSGVSTGAVGASSVQKVIAIYNANVVHTCTGGTTTETLNIGLTNRGFSAKPDAGALSFGSAHDGVNAHYDPDTSTSTNAVVILRKTDGTNFGAGNAYRVLATFVEYD